MRPLQIAFEPEFISDLRDRIRRTRWPSPPFDTGWERGYRPRDPARAGRLLRALRVGLQPVEDGTTASLDSLDRQWE